MPRTKEQFNQMKQERRERLLESSLILYSLYGENFTVDQVAEMSKCSHGIIYHYFKNTAEITAKLLNSSIYAQLKSTLIKPYKGVVAKETITQIIQVLISVESFKEICYANILLSEKGKNTLRNAVSNLIQRGQLEGDIAGGDPNEITSCLFYLLSGYYIQKITKPKEKISKPSFDNVMELFRKKR